MAIAAGPYSLGEEKIADLPVLAQGPDGKTFVVGRFPFTHQYDALGQANAYTALPELVALAVAIKDMKPGDRLHVDTISRAAKALFKAGIR